jgi:hypothetical protein
MFLLGETGLIKLRPSLTDCPLRFDPLRKGYSPAQVKSDANDYTGVS